VAASLAVIPAAVVMADASSVIAAAMEEAVASAGAVSAADVALASAAAESGPASRSASASASATAGATAEGRMKRGGYGDGWRGVGAAPACAAGAARVVRRRRISMAGAFDPRDIGMLVNGNFSGAKSSRCLGWIRPVWIRASLVDVGGGFHARTGQLETSMSGPTGVRRWRVAPSCFSSPFALLVCNRCLCATRCSPQIVLRNN
jgi:hypothetical protein